MTKLAFDFTKLQKLNNDVGGGIILSEIDLQELKRVIIDGVLTYACGKDHGYTEYATNNYVSIKKCC